MMRRSRAGIRPSDSLTPPLSGATGGFGGGSGAMPPPAGEASDARPFSGEPKRAMGSKEKLVQDRKLQEAPRGGARPVPQDAAKNAAGEAQPDPSGVAAKDAPQSAVLTRPGKGAAADDAGLADTIRSSERPLAMQEAQGPDAGAAPAIRQSVAGSDNRFLDGATVSKTRRLRILFRVIPPASASPTAPAAPAASGTQGTQQDQEK